MSAESMEPTQGSRRTLALRNLYLDPNNFRIVDHPDYRLVRTGQELADDVQRRTTSMVLGRNQYQVRDLIASVKENGWLDIDPILVQRKARGRFLVIEGNRRVATLKYLQRRYDEDSIDLNNLNPAVFSSVPTVLYDADDDRHRMLMMGLHHITGKRRWPAINRALAMKRLLDHFDGDANAVCRALGVWKHELNLSIKTLALVDLYKNSDYGDQFRSEQYNLFREILRSPSMRAWLGWDDSQLAVANKVNLDRLFLWMSRDDQPEDTSAQPGEARSTSEPVVATVVQVRELARVIGDPEAVERLEETNSLQEATLSSKLLVKNEIDRVFKTIGSGIQNLHRRLGDLDSEALDRVDQFIGQLQEASLARRRRPPGAESRSPWKPFNEIARKQFSSIRIKRYRGIDGLDLESPGRVNVVVGPNNAGKTSLLESIYVLAHQNDERGLLDVLRWRARMDGDPEPRWIVDQLSEAIQVSGIFDEVERNSARVAIALADEPGENVQDQTSFLGELAIEACYGGQDQTAEVVFFGDRARRTSFRGRHWLCRAVFTSPFSASRAGVLERSHKESLEAGTKGRIIDFIRTRVDSGVVNIELADSTRFLVSHKAFGRALDLSFFGDGVRRIFQIGLLFASARGGVLLIDEFENAIHASLLEDFTRLVQELAVELDVQVFLTTHSKETLDAWLLNGYRTEDVVGYALGRADGRIMVRRYDGERLLRLHEAVDFDLRGVR